MSSLIAVTNALPCFSVALNLTKHRRDCLRANDADMVFAVLALVTGGFGFEVFQMIARRGTHVVTFGPCGIINIVLGLRIIWYWWRKRRKPRPSRIAGRVRDLGHRLVVVPA